MKDHRIEIIVNTPFRPLRGLFVAALQISVIGIGAILDSSAMQWSGFIFFLLAMTAFAASKVKENKNLTIDQARVRLDAIERGEV